jgi:hypothetical protein
VRQAAFYVGLPPRTFLARVNSGDYPRPRPDGRWSLWDRLELDGALDRLGRTHAVQNVTIGGCADCNDESHAFRDHFDEASEQAVEPGPVSAELADAMTDVQAPIDILTAATDGPASVGLVDEFYAFCEDRCRSQAMFMTVDQVARELRCSVDSVRRIPKNELPCSRPGKVNLYDPEDVRGYVRRMQKGNRNMAKGSQSGGNLITCLADSVRKRSTQKEEHHERV